MNHNIEAMRILPPTEAVLRVLDPRHQLPDGVWAAGVHLPDEVGRELSRLLAHCLVRDEVLRMEERRDAEEVAAASAEDYAALAAELGLSWDEEFQEFTGGGMWAARRDGRGWRIFGSMTSFPTARAALISWRG